MRPLVLSALIGCLSCEAAAQTSPRGAPARDCTPSRQVRCPDAAETLLIRNAAARRSALDGGFSSARQVHEWSPGALYELTTRPGFVSVVLLEPGESVTAIAAGDTSRWMVSEAVSELAGDARAVILVKPLAVSLMTNIVIVTDRRTYLIEARTSGSAYAAELAWSYPQTATSAAIVSANTQTRSGYRIRVMRGARPVWTPAAVFDDGQRTFIEFPAAVAAADLPPLFVITGEGAELVNYRFDGARYVVDRLFERAELRLGARAPVIVRIERRPAHRARSGRR